MSPFNWLLDNSHHHVLCRFQKNLFWRCFHSWKWNEGSLTLSIQEPPLGLTWECLYEVNAKGPDIKHKFRLNCPEQSKFTELGLIHLWRFHDAQSLTQNEHWQYWMHETRKSQGQLESISGLACCYNWGWNKTVCCSFLGEADLIFLYNIIKS